MTLDVALRPFYPFPRVFRAHSEEPQQDYHWVGQKGKTPQGGANQGGQKNNPPGPKEKSEYRPLSSITLGEVDEAIRLFEHQLVPAHENWISKDHFCKIVLKRRPDGRPPVIFGRVKTCYPSDGAPANIEDIELSFPHKGNQPYPVLLQGNDIDHLSQHAVQSYYLRVSFLMTADEIREFEGSDPLFMNQGFLAEFNPGYLDILEMTERDHAAYPWLYVIGLRWLASAPGSIYPEVCAKVEKMIHWRKRIFNYHPYELSKDIFPLNRVFGWKNGLTATALFEPENPQETSMIVVKEFSNIFNSVFDR